MRQQGQVGWQLSCSLPGACQGRGAGNAGRYRQTDSAGTEGSGSSWQAGTASRQVWQACRHQLLRAGRYTGWQAGRHTGRKTAPKQPPGSPFIVSHLSANQMPPTLIGQQSVCLKPSPGLSKPAPISRCFCHPHCQGVPSVLNPTRESPEFKAPYLTPQGQVPSSLIPNLYPYFPNNVEPYIYFSPILLPI